MVNSVSVVLTVRNVEKYIASCLRSLLDQTFNDFEVIIIDDVSTDNTKKIIEEFSDTRIKYLRNTKWLGLSSSRNKSLANAIGVFIFFTDGDCIVSKNWIEEGLKHLKMVNCIGAEGKTYYISKDYKPTRSDDVVQNKIGGLFNTCNIAYKKSVLESIGGFDERFTFHEDRDMALRALEYGTIHFNENMIVYHQKKVVKPKQFVKKGKIIQNRVLLYKKLGVKINFIWRIVNPEDLLAILFPPLTFSSLFMNVYKSKEDFDLFPFIYVKLFYERLALWTMCAREKVFLI